jgi:hypothetical protein
VESIPAALAADKTNNNTMPIDYNKYPPNWLSEIRPRIMKRANNACEECGAPHGSFVYRTAPNSDTKKDWVFLAYSTPDLKSISEAFIITPSLLPPDVQPVKVVKIVLTIAHLDHDHENCNVSDDRLKALCQRCHLKLDLPHHINNRKYGRNWKKNQTSLEL